DEGEEIAFLVQGTLYPDVVESGGGSGTANIKSHHNVGGLPDDIQFELIEPLRALFKDEVRAIGRELGVPEAIVSRQPFPGPGLGIRIIGEVTEERLNILRRADAIARAELTKAGLDGEIWQCPVVLLADVRSVGVQGDGRTYGHPVVLRPVSSEDAMTADWTRIPYDVLSTISNRITNEVDDINRVVLDVTSKPPGTIEWERSSARETHGQRRGDRRVPPNSLPERCSATVVGYPGSPRVHPESDRMAHELWSTHDSGTQHRLGGSHPSPLRRSRRRYRPHRGLRRHARSLRDDATGPRRPRGCADHSPDLRDRPVRNGARAVAGRRGDPALRAPRSARTADLLRYERRHRRARRTERRLHPLVHPLRHGRGIHRPLGRAPLRRAEARGGPVPRRIRRQP